MSERGPVHKTSQQAEPVVYEAAEDFAVASKKAVNTPALTPETGGPSGLEPTRYGDWERKGRCIDF